MTVATNLKTLTYRFELKGGESKDFTLRFDAKNHLVQEVDLHPKPWTALNYHQCGHCPLAQATTPVCPVAKNLDTIVEAYKSTLSYTVARVTVITPERTYSRECSLQDGLRSLFGLVMASSGCPHLEWLRPMARFHLPFSTIEETLYRVLSVQLLESFLADTNPSAMAVGEKIRQRYKQVETLNHAFIERIRSYCEADADKNALAALDIFVQFFEHYIENNFDTLRPYFVMS